MERRFAIASGHHVAATDLVELGLLEPRGEQGFRVRGMSRYFAPVQARNRAKKQAAAGGRARMAAAARSATGRVLGAGVLAGSPAGGSAGSDQPETSRQPADSQPTHQPTTSRQPALAYIDQRSTTDLKTGETPSVPPAPPVPLELLPAPEPKRRRERKPPDPEAEFARFKAACTPDEARVFETWCVTFGVELGADWALQKFVASRLKSHTAEELCAAIKGHARDPFLAKNPSLRSIFRDASHIAIQAKRGAA